MDNGKQLIINQIKAAVNNLGFGAKVDYQPAMSNDMRELFMIYIVGSDEDEFWDVHRDSIQCALEQVCRKHGLEWGDREVDEDFTLKGLRWGTPNKR